MSKQSGADSRVAEDQAALLGETLPATVDIPFWDQSAKPGGSDTAPWPADGATLIAERYVLTHFIAKGGMGTVYRAVDRELDETVALKVIHRGLLDNPRALSNLKREVKLARRVTHPNVARTFDIGEHDGLKFLSLEYVEGKSLRKELNDCKTSGQLMGITKAAEIAASICLGLEAAHDLSIVHRDLKPENVLIGNDGRVLISDFGVARSAVDQGPGDLRGDLVGTPAYMAPEQFLDEGSNHRADLYALGVILFEMLTGYRPFSTASGNPVSLAAFQLTHPPPSPRDLVQDLPLPISALTMSLLRCNPADRPQTARVVYETLAQVVELGARGTPRVRVRAAAGQKLIAVLPLVNRGDPQDDSVVAGLTEDLIDQIAIDTRLRVKPYATVQQYVRSESTRSFDTLAIGTQLGVDAVIEGKIQRDSDANEVRIVVRAIAVETGVQIWTQRFVGAQSAMLQLSSEIANSIGLALTGKKQERLQRTVVDSAAIDLYLRARQQLRRVELSNVGSTLQLAELALKSAPDDPAFVVLAAGLQARAWFLGYVDSDESAESFAKRALMLAPGRAESHLAMAMVDSQRNRYREMAASLQSALRIGSMTAEPHTMAARFLAEIGEVPRSLKQFGLAISLDPHDQLLVPEMARIQYLSGEQSAAMALIDQCTKMAERTTWTAVARLVWWAGDQARAYAILKLPEITEPKNRIVRAVLERTVGITGAEDPIYLLQTAIRTRRASPRGSSYAHQIFTEMYADAGRVAEALTSLEESVTSGLIDVLWIESCPKLAALRGLDRFCELQAVIRNRAEELKTTFAEL